MEKTDEELDLRFPAGNSPALAQLLEEVALDDHPADEDARRARVAAAVSAARSAADAHVELYRSLVKSALNVAPTKPIRATQNRSPRLAQAGVAQA